MLFSSVSDISDREFLETVYNKYSNMLFFIAKDYLHIDDIAEDVVHDVFIKIIPKVTLLRSFNDRRLRAYLVTATKNTSISKSNDIHTDNARLIYYDSDNIILVDTKKTIEDYLYDKERIRLFSKAMELLDEQDRYLLHSKYVLQMKDKEIAENIHVQASSIRMMLTRARRRVIYILQEMEDDG